MVNDSDAAKLALFVVYAMDQYLAARLDDLQPPPDPRLAPDWQILGYLTGFDTVLRAGEKMAQGEERCYGYLAQSLTLPLEHVVAIRGTNGTLEWIEDAEFLPCDHPIAGKVESGFWGVYQSMLYTPIAGQVQAAAAGIASAVGKGHVTMLGHSLGSTLATYLTFDLACAGVDVSGYFFASPHPGNLDFAKAFDALVVDYRVYNYELDVVPRVPFGPDYSDLLRVREIKIGANQARIGFSLDCHHHLLCYCAMLDYSLLDWKSVPAIDQPYVVCIKGPA